MLRNFVGDSAFFKSINHYLTTNKFKSAEAHQLRLSFEEVTGRDLNWFFNQWYFGNGHPVAEINYVYDDAAGKATVIVKQTQKTGKIFKLPLAIDLYQGPSKTRYKVWVTNAVDSFSFPYTKRPDLINVDGDKVMLWSKKDNKTLENYIHQYQFAGSYLDRKEAIEFAATKGNEPKAVELLRTALTDPFHGLRSLAIGKTDLKKESIRKATEAQLVQLAKTDKNALVRAAAIGKLGDLQQKEYNSMFTNATNDSSYTVAGNALAALIKTDPEAAKPLIQQLGATAQEGLLADVLLNEMMKAGDETQAEKIIGDFAKMPLSQGKFDALNGLSTYLSAIKHSEKAKWGVEEIVKFRDAIPDAYKGQTDYYINSIVLKGILSAKSKLAKEQPTDSGLLGLVEYIKSKLPEADKKGF